MLIESLKDHSLILASKSPRRKQLLEAMELPFIVKLRPVDEVAPSGLSATDTAKHIAKLKADAFKNDLGPKEIVITGDTIVWHENQALGKPKDATEAFKMIKGLSNTSHEVISSICLLTKDKLVADSDTAKVHFKHLSDREINHYISTYKPYDKAGAYGIQEWIGHIGIMKLEGSFNTVMGLPTHLLYQMLSRLMAH